MVAEMATESQEIVVMALDKYIASSKWETAMARMMKKKVRLFEKKWGGSWHVCVGEGFGFRVTHQAKLMLHVYYNKVGVVVYNVNFCSRELALLEGSV